MTITRFTHDVQQGSAEWLALRARHFTASEAPAMLGASKYQTRADLLRQKATGLAAEVDAGTQRRFDAGHAAEAAARPVVEEIIGEELYPATMTAEVEGLPLLASMDGITMLCDVGWETKLLNEQLKADVLAGSLDDHYAIQLEQQLLVSGCDRIYFTTTDGTRLNTFGTWYDSNPLLRDRIIAGWHQFAKDLAEYSPEPVTESPEGRAPDALPALRIEVTGMVTASNLDAFKSHALAVFGSINTDLQTDADFADAEKAVKWCKEVEDRLDGAKQHALSQTESIDALFRTIDSIRDEARAVRLKLDKLVKSEKEARKLQIVTQAQKALHAHVAALNDRIGGNYIPNFSSSQFGESIKGLKSLDSMRDKINGALANAKIEASAIADRIERNRKQVDDMSLVPDFAQVCTKAPDDFDALLAMRVQQRVEAEAKRLESERERIRVEEQARAQREAREAAAREAADRAAEASRIVPSAMARIDEASATGLVTPELAGELRKTVADMASEIAIERASTKAAEDGALIPLGQINQRLSPISLSAAGIAQLGIQPAGRERAAVLYRESDIPRICEALIRHLSSVAAGKQEAA